ncbi:TIM barrel protein [Candidatus Methanoperedens nitratireducens]|uniref:Xylose isomerase-like TIM barrel domain-containing protein n=1 Tax=Candidatus Methanoperedens nitratireducens TaxID=1392998 RepID=A0A284VR71_9EURY|nr:TIM barrel protein [Candidatus Methanoperedens nitroreducens]SNQ61781.1 hypothetical protein MNV_50040 [Candidatus Methanoperedens nitroreducens]
MERLLFGTAGTPLSSKGNDSLSGIKRVRELGLGCMELEFVRGIRMGESMAHMVAEVAKELDVRLSVHAPYYINLNAAGDTLAKSRERILNSARIGSICGARSVVIHAGYFQGETGQAVYGKIKKQLMELIEQLRSEDMNITEGVFAMHRFFTSARKDRKVQFPRGICICSGADREKAWARRA